ncbi:expansin-YoaJ-like [Ptychodera flava]|uniref:expansin-YoaJ-like n=1 Tax=Ptychodera flava TaxID=63121 RepID=UPI00396A44AF
MFVRSLLLVFSCLCFTGLSDTSSTCDVTLDGPFTGEITHYDHAHEAASGSGACMLDTEGDLMVAALNPFDLNGKVLCGQCIEVTNGDGVKITVKVIDLCPECPEHNIDLSQDAFQLLYPLQVGRIEIEWRLIECERRGNIRYNFKYPQTGSNWWGVKVVDHIHGVESMSLKPAEEGDDRDWIQYERTQNQNFKKPVEERRINAPFHVRITSTLGEVIEDYFDGVPTKQTNTLPGSVQFRSICDIDPTEYGVDRGDGVNGTARNSSNPWNIGRDSLNGDDDGKSGVTPTLYNISHLLSLVAFSTFQVIL